MELWSIGLRSCLQSISYYVLVMRVLECKTTGVAVCGSSASFEPLAGPFVAVSVQRAASCACSSAWHCFVISSGSVEQKALLYQEACRRESPPMFLTDVCSIMDFFLSYVLLQNFRPTLWLRCFYCFKLYCLNVGSGALTLRTWLASFSCEYIFTADP